MNNQLKLFVFAVLTMLTVGALPGCSRKVSADPTPDAGPISCDLTSRKTQSDSGKNYKESVMAEYKLRQELQMQFIADACQVAKETKDAEAEKTCEFLRANLITIMNIGPGFVVFDPTPRKQPVALFIYLGNELEESPELLGEVMANEYALGSVVPFATQPLMILRHKNFTRFSRALIVLHEGKHAQLRYSLPTNKSPQTDLEIALEEVGCYEFGMRLMDKVGGEKYAALIQDQVDWLDKIDLKKMTEKEVDARYEGHIAAISEIFRATDKSEVQFLWFQFSMETKFRYIARLAPDKKSADEMKAEIYLQTAR